MKFLNYTLALLLLLSVASCQQDDYNEVIYDDVEELMLEYLESEEQYSELVAIITKSGLYDILSLAGTYTLFAPNNDAFASYYNTLGYTGIDDLSVEACESLIKDHLLAEKIMSTEFRAGTLDERNLNNDYVLIAFDAEGESKVYVNEAASEQLDIDKLNGVIHELNDVIKPYENTLLETLEAGDYSLFLEALDSTGYLDSLDVKHFNGENYYTVLAITDSVYALHGFTSFQDLKDSLATGADLLDQENKLNISMGNSLVRKFYSVNDFYNQESRYYSTISMYPAQAIVLDYVFFNPRKEVDEDGRNHYYLSTYIDLGTSNTMASHGIIHNITDIMHPIEIVKEEQTFYFSSIDTATQIISDSEGEYVYGSGYLVYGSNDEAVVGDYFTFEGPILLSGRYDIYLTNPSYQAGTILLALYVNGEQVGDAFIDSNGEKYIGEIDVPYTSNMEVTVELASLYTDASKNKMRLSNMRIVPIE